ncbi:MAG: T9SS type A sorting domain-containing protein [Bacteroidales bacterium]|nr:T9SS type A sorting domain-containing protein [Bacteroidales bacterium]MDT8430575.1 T9SS type A sorting domain-containing protein [Bacteroidales bacterium]
MKKPSLISILLSVIVLPCYNQQLPERETVASEENADCTSGITSFEAICSMEALDSVIHFEFREDHPDPNISRKFFYFDENSLLDSIVERYEDNVFKYTSGYSVRYTYEESGRIADVFKSSWNDQIRHLFILIRETYNYDESGSFTRNSNIEWRTANDTSRLDVNEAYAYDASSQLSDYTMNIPREINPDNAIYKEVYHYDSIGTLSSERKELSEAGERLNLVETRYRNNYREQNLLHWIHSDTRENEQGDWHQAEQLQFFYDELDRNTMRTKTSESNTGPVHEKQLFSYDVVNNVIKEIRYISSDSVHYQLADSVLYYYAMADAEEVKENEEEKEEEEIEEEEDDFFSTPDPFDFKLFPNPTDGILHVRSGFDSPSIINIIDAAGKVVFTTRVENGVADIDLSPYPDGFYIITVTSVLGYQTGKVFKF